MAQPSTSIENIGNHLGVSFCRRAITLALFAYYIATPLFAGLSGIPALIFLIRAYLGGFAHEPKDVTWFSAIYAVGVALGFCLALSFTLICGLFVLCLDTPRHQNCFEVISSICANFKVATRRW
jgi:hypothetical protein